MCDNPGWGGGGCDTMVRFVNSRNRRGTSPMDSRRSSDLAPAPALQLPIEIWRQVRAVYVIQPTEAAFPLATFTGWVSGVRRM